MSQTKNTFGKGVVNSSDILVQQQDTIASARNAEFMSVEGSAFLVTGQKGTKSIGNVLGGYLPVVVKEHKSVSYIFAIEVREGKATGKAVLGTYPSPEWRGIGDQPLINTFSPLRNYGGDNDQSSSKSFPFISDFFKATLDANYEMQLQNDYDGSVNIILNDGKNPPLIINSGFAVKPGAKAEIITRLGKSTNRYDKSNFENVLRLILNSSKILTLNFRGVNEGGQQKAGNYKYFFYYMTNDGSLTQMIEESSTVHVFNGSSPADVIGDRATGDRTNKLTTFELSNLDDSFPFVKVYFTLSYGESSAQKTTYELINPIQINGTTAVFTHTGYEQESIVPPDFLNKRIGSIESVGTIAQVKGHLFAANVKEKGSDMEVLRKFASRIKTGHKQIKMDIFGTKPALDGVRDPKSSEAKIADAFEGGYYNPYNIYHHTGYFGNETYPFAICFIYKDGSVTPAFPTLAIDNSTAGNDPLLQSFTGAQLDGIITSGGFLQGDQNLVNTNGIYRFPSRENASGILFDDNDKTLIKVNGVRFRMPEINGTEFEAVRKETIGCFFVRAERKPDLLSQGYLIDTITVPTIDIGDADKEFESMAQYRAGYSEITSKFVPAFDFTLEAVKAYDTYNPLIGGGRQRHPDKGEGGIHPFKFHFRNKDFAFRKKFAFISPEVILDKERILQVLSSREIKMNILAKVNTVYDFNSRSELDRNGGHFSLIRTDNFQRQIQNIDAKANWTVGGNGLRNNEGFSGALFANAREWRTNKNRDIRYFHFPIEFNDYIGITTQQMLTLGDPSPSEGERDGRRINGLFGQQKQASVLVNIYPDRGPRTADNIRSIYTSLSNESYSQISPRMYWNDQIDGADPLNTVEAKKDVDGDLVFFGGDCFINPIFRKIFFNQYNDIASDIDDTNQNSKSNVGYSLGLVTESSVNSAIRSEQVSNINEAGKRTFLPFGMNSTNQGDTFGEGNPLRKSRLIESSLFNKGYKTIQSVRDYFTFSANLSFVGSNWFSRVIASPKFIPNSFDNAYRNLSGVNFQDYNPELGEIIRILNYRDNLLLVFENGIILLPINQRIQTGGDQAGAIFIEAMGVLPPEGGEISLHTGSKWHDSIIETDFSIYGVDTDSDIIWSIKDGAINETSRFRIDPTVRDFVLSYKTASKTLLGKNISAHYDRSRRELIWSFIGKDKGADTISYNEINEFFTGGVDYIPVTSFNLLGKFHSFDSQLNTSTIQRHGDSDSLFCNFYGKQQEFRISFVVNENPDFHKVFDNLVLVSNNVLPDKIIYRTQGTYTEQKVNYDSRLRRLSNVTYKMNQANVAVPVVGRITDQGENGFVETLKDNAKSLLRRKSRQKGHAILIELVYNSDKMVKLSSVLTDYRNVQ